MSNSAYIFIIMSLLYFIVFLFFAVSLNNIAKQRGRECGIKHEKDRMYHLLAGYILKYTTVDIDRKEVVVDLLKLCDGIAEELDKPLLSDIIPPEKEESNDRLDIRDMWNEFEEDEELAK